MEELTIVSEICRLAIAITFVLAMVNKIIAFNEFEHSLSENLGLTIHQSQWLTKALVLAEIAVSILLISNIYPLFSMGLALLLLCAFTIFITYNLWQENRITCNCFGSGKQLISGYDLIRNISLLIIGSIYLLISNTSMPDLPYQFLCMGLASILLLIIFNLRLVILVVK